MQHFSRKAYTESHEKLAAFYCPRCHLGVIILLAKIGITRTWAISGGRHSVFIGILLGFLIRQFASLSVIEKNYLGFPGEIFLRLIKLLILPLIVSSLISSIGNIAKHNIGECLIMLFSF